MPSTPLAAALENTIDLALATLREGVVAAKNSDEAGSREGLFLAAKRYIETHLCDPNMKVDDIAQAVACSRATLYRIFAEHDLTVAGYIRELRLQRFAMLLQQGGESATIADLAERCGVLDPGNFSELFKQRFGITPRKALQLYKANKTLPDAATF